MRSLRFLCASSGSQLLNGTKWSKMMRVNHLLIGRIWVYALDVGQVHQEEACGNRLTRGYSSENRNKSGTSNLPERWHSWNLFLIFTLFLLGINWKLRKESIEPQHLKSYFLPDCRLHASFRPKGRSIDIRMILEWVPIYTYNISYNPYNIIQPCIYIYMYIQGTKSYTLNRRKWFC